MTLVLLQAMIQSISSTLHWVGFYVGIRALPGDQWRRRRWALGSAIIFTAWLIGAISAPLTMSTRPRANSPLPLTVGP